MVTLDHLIEAQKRIQLHIHTTPVVTSSILDDLTGASLFFKSENLQRGGAFKFRGACNAVLSLSESQAQLGVATHSSGNHAAALCLAARIKGIKAFIVMPENAPEIKRRAVMGYGGEITYCKPTLEDREKTLSQVVSDTQAVVIHPYNDERIIAGQGTAALELMDSVPDLDMVLVPVGGGGLLSGTAVGIKSTNRKVMVIGAEPSAADDAYRSFRSGKLVPSVNPQTVADGLRTSLGSLTFPIIREYVDDIVTVEEQEIVNAMRLFWERINILIEPSSAVPVAAVLTRKVQVSGKRVGVILSGGNVDPERLPWMPGEKGGS